ncbi:MAG: bifunctional phosphopantothenoylcysteine decarboxylase/phosphopantothenate--cysteine ligase CoaBC [Bacteroidetes bacterium]|nr:MAG: bifunctional phosphopantothenoylcysteine decarboxylase/phosphopantothenate--cysteine ligase CoaBC [Bacteroidota bacterium]
MSLRGKKIVLAVTGSIAAYKAAFLTRLLVKQGAEVQVLMTADAEKFISPLTLATLSKKKVISALTDAEQWSDHVSLGLWADLMLVAPATANTLAKFAAGICDNIVTAVYLSAKCPVFFAPAMDLDMWKHPSTQHNIKRLVSFGNRMIPVGHGELASGLVGDGRMAEPEDIVRLLDIHFAEGNQFKGKTVLVTAGPTYEPIDPVRFIGNYSSGKMGIALATGLANRGAKVNLVIGPSRISIPDHPNIKVFKVTTAQQMYDKAVQLYPECDVAIMAAAVADYRPKQEAAEKIKKSASDMTLELEKTPDIAAGLGKMQQSHQLNIGFALETNDEEANAKAKLVKKNFDFIVLNSLQDPGAGFNHDTNKITILKKDNTQKNFELKSKTEVAADIIDEIAGMLFPGNGNHN